MRTVTLSARLTALWYTSNFFKQETHIDLVSGLHLRQQLQEGKCDQDQNHCYRCSRGANNILLLQYRRQD